jgi:signal recognition particle receptor subunit beta
MLSNKQDVKNALTITDIQTVFNKIALNLEAMDSKVLGVSALEGLGLFN